MDAGEGVLAQPQPVGEDERAEGGTQIGGLLTRQVLRQVDGEHRRPLVEDVEVAQVGEVLGPAHDHGQVLGEDGTVGAVDLPDLHRAVARLPATADHDPVAVDALEPGLAAEHRPEGLGDRQPRRVLERLAHEQRVRDVVGTGEVVAHDEVAHAGPGQRLRQPRGPAALGESPLEGIQRPHAPGRDQGHHVAHGPTGVGQPLGGLVVRRAPLVAGEGRAGHEQRGGVAVLGLPLLQPPGRGTPVARHGHHRLGRRDPPDQRGHGTRGHHGDRRGGEHPAVDPLRARGRGPGSTGPGAQRLDDVRQADDQREPHHGVELVDVADRGQHAVEQLLQRRGAPPGDGALVAQGHQQQTQQQAPHEERAVRVAAQHQAGAPEEEQHRGVEREVRRGEQVAPGPGGGVDVGDPVGGAAQRVGQRRRERGDRGGLDPLQERRAVGAHEHQRHQPPQGADEGEDRPPEHERATARAGRAGQQPDHAERDDGEGGRGVDAADQRDREPGAGSRAPRAPPLRADHQRQQHPRGQRHRPALAGDGTQGGEHPRGERVRRPGEQAGQVAAHPEGPHQARGAREGDGQHQPPPQPLDDPAGDAGQDAGEEERPRREEVAVGLVLQLAEGALAVPQVQGTLEEVGRRGDEVELGVRDEVAGVLGEGQSDQQAAAGQQAEGEAAHRFPVISCGAPGRGSR
ncbi:unannotated protein [freshwater metagenome]|uniref:Unannotated protein n=1 Tax=freshwater metagenome TaxID=449393 RepID=A0A6J6T387_9ZZZZ